MKSLLILSCSQRKRDDPAELPAIERYDGPTFRTLRKARREGYWPHNLEVLILSAEFGLIEAETPIPWYDRLMDRKRAIELRPPVSQALAGRLEGCRIFVHLGSIYRLALPDLPPETIYATGAPGQRAAQIKTWLIEISGRS